MLVLLASLFFLAGIAMAETVRFDPQEISVKPGETVTVDLILADIQRGLSGYSAMTMSDTPGIAEITSVNFPAWAELTEAEGVPGSGIQITGVDLNGEIEENVTNVNLATFTIKGLATGTTTLGFQDIFLDDDQGNRIIPSVKNATIVVSTTSIGATLIASANMTEPASPSMTTTASLGAAASGGSGSSSGSSGTVMAAGTTPSAPGITGTIGQVTTLPAQQTQEAGGGQVPEMTTTGKTKPPGAESPAGPGIPFLSLPGMAAFLVTLVIMAVWFRKREDGN